MEGELCLNRSHPKPSQVRWILLDVAFLFERLLPVPTKSKDSGVELHLANCGCTVLL